MFIITVANSCDGMSVVIERMTAMSSMLSPMCGKISLTSTPLWPDFLNLNCDGSGTPPMSFTSWPAYFAMPGFGSHVSMCDGPPCEKMWMTRLALPGNCGACGASGERLVAAWAVPPSDRPEQTREAERAEAHAEAVEELAAGDAEIVCTRLVLGNVHSWE